MTSIGELYEGARGADGMRLLSCGIAVEHVIALGREYDERLASDCNTCAR
eukprot:CAMPEP_0174703162 /NCGR_PEP_ID=MMETSP1094-20130205/7209_1 /TAXON_ID=156173 /ORGANISM="Chrysochromulina brevifilum, Strain UTEX LB 985" /LENGTH=49 /DNA_ID=CAMNT_0015901043 /DNA_START=676 /DNA_END=825 /DNA_ORIENTATION=-